MGVVAQEKPSSMRTGELTKWINRVKTKKRMNRSSRRCNLYMQAVLTHALAAAEGHLTEKRRQRQLRWYHKLSEMADHQGAHPDVANNNNNNKQQMAAAPGAPTQYDEDELTSFDNFMSQLKTVQCIPRST